MENPAETTPPKAAKSKPPKTTAERIEAMKEKANQLKAKAQKLQGKERSQTRKTFERKKYVIGASIMAAIQAGKYTEEQAAKFVDHFNTKASDRALFGLQPKPNPPEKQETQHK